MTATALFGEVFTLVYRHYWRKCVDYKEAPKKNPLGSLGTTTNPYASLWKARQAADSIGATYRNYCFNAFEWLHDRGWKHLPMPGQLYGDQLIKAVQEKWLEYCIEGRPSVSSDPRYLVKNWEEHPFQIGHATWICEQALQQSHGHYLLEATIARRSVVPEEFARRFFLSTRFPSIVDKALAYPPTPEELPDTPELDFRPGCFGLPHARSAKDELCEICPSSGSCHDRSIDALSRVVAEHGTASPAEDRKRKQATARKRRQRERERAAKRAGNASERDQTAPEGN